MPPPIFRSTRHDGRRNSLAGGHGAGHGRLVEAALGAVAACALVLVIGMLLRQPLARVPENGLKFGVGVLLTAFGVFWSGEGLGLRWLGAEWSLLGLVALFSVVGLTASAVLRRTGPRQGGQP